MIEITCYYDEEAEEYKLINRSLEKESMVVASDSKLFYALKKYLCNCSNEALFRGQNQTWDPIPGLFRDMYSHLLKNEKEYYLNVKRDHIVELGNLNNQFAFWSKIQHYEYPTRLLDVSTNCFKALAFMIYDIDIEKVMETKPCIYIFEPKTDIQKIYINEFSGEVEYKNQYPIIIPANNQHDNIRLHAQSGQFIFADIDNVEEISDSKVIDGLLDHYDITKVTISINESKAIKGLEQKLSEYNYGVDTLYPDMVKRSNYYKNKWKK